MSEMPRITSFEEFEAATLPILFPPYKSKFGAIDLDDLERPGPEHEALVKGILTRGEVGMLVGPSGSGKSFLATDMAFRIGRGIDYMAVRVSGRVVHPKVRRGGVVYIAGEGARGLKKRLRAYIRANGIRGADVPFVLLTLPVDLHNSDDHTVALIEEAKVHSQRFQERHGVRLELVVLDTLSASTPGANENASDDVSRVLGRCHRIAQECDCAVQLVHHMNASGTRERGHSSLRANVDSVIEVTKSDALRDADDRPIRIAKVTKQKDGEDGVTWQFVLPSVEIGVDAEGDPVTSCIVRPPKEHEDAERGEEAFELKGNVRRFMFDCLIRAMKLEGVRRPDNVKAPADVTVVTEDQWKAVALARAPTREGDTPEKRRDRVYTAVGRAMTDLQNVNLVGADHPYLWLTGKKVKGFPSWIRPAAPSRERDQPEPEQDDPEW